MEKMVESKLGRGGTLMSKNACNGENGYLN